VAPGESVVRGEVLDGVMHYLQRQVVCVAVALWALKQAVWGESLKGSLGLRLGCAPHATLQKCPWGARRGLGGLRVHENCENRNRAKNRVRDANCGYAKGFLRAPIRLVWKTGQVSNAREQYLAGSGGVCAKPACHWTAQVYSTDGADMGVANNEH
jgi:hypothetical protein